MKINTWSGKSLSGPYRSQGRVTSSRPSSNQGSTFHFSHSYVSKGRNQSSSPYDQTTAPKHQSYIEREEAVEKDEEKELEKIAKEEGIEVHIHEKRMSFGTIGKSKAERTKFWRNVENFERKNGRVQCRIIAELPHELSAKERARITAKFTKIFIDKKLPFWTSLHSPTKKNDQRNYHLHLSYYDRPSTKKENQEWDFMKTEVIKDKNRVTRTTYPERQDKDRTAQGKEWILKLRTDFAEINNEILKSNKIDKTLDPNSYKDSGILKNPSTHLGNKAAYAELSGIPTRIGDINTKKEIEWKLSRKEREMDKSQKILESIREMSMNSPLWSDPKKKKSTIDDMDSFMKMSEQFANKAMELEKINIETELNIRRIKKRYHVTNDTVEKKEISSLNDEMGKLVTAKKKEFESIKNDINTINDNINKQILKMKIRIYASLNEDKPTNTTSMTPEEKAIFALTGKTEKGEYKELTESFIRKSKEENIIKLAQQTMALIDMSDTQKEKDLYQKDLNLIIKIAQERKIDLTPKDEVIKQRIIQNNKNNNIENDR